ncbi:unnamed protein product [Owenia fusiformis]|uniref:AN1-type domain-containing protein n=1 Tax=Owenia fusiformis TaxID=6347 RepID=A0A8S4NDB7_OWEFU|nr:unnamed protein product [Owenia fusiformis]
MAELDIGKHCDFTSCQQLDFLPFECNSCHRVFCKFHRSTESHKCSLECAPKPKVEYTGDKGHPCFMPDCTNRELIPVICEQCKNNYCLSHRHQQDHNCDKLEKISDVQKMPQTAAHVQNILDKRKDQPSPSKGRGRKSKKTESKVQLMKMKMNAVGDKGLPPDERIYFRVLLPHGTPDKDKAMFFSKGLPPDERIYFRVLLPHGTPDKDKAMFFSKTWTIGRAVDRIATVCDLKNENNISYAKKLRLFDTNVGAKLNVDSTIEDALVESSEVFNGSTLILEYVENDCNILDDFQSYS